MRFEGAGFHLLFHFIDLGEQIEGEGSLLGAIVDDALQHGEGKNGRILIGNKKFIDRFLEALAHGINILFSKCTRRY